MRHRFSGFSERPFVANESCAMCAHEDEEKRQSFSCETFCSGNSNSILGARSAIVKRALSHSHLASAMGSRVATTYLAIKTPKAFTNLQPRVARLSALPWESELFYFTNPERLPSLSYTVCELFQSSPDNQRGYPGRCPGLEFANAFGVPFRCGFRDCLLKYLTPVLVAVPFTHLL